MKVGLRGTNDVAWVGPCTNTAAKLSNIFDHPATIGITSDVFKLLSSIRKTSQSMWSVVKTSNFGGVARTYRTSTYRRTIS